MTVLKPTVFIYESLIEVLSEFDQRFFGLEYSILLKETETQKGKFFFDEISVPRQRVDSCSVEYDNDEVSELISKGFGAVLHKHPDGAPYFSLTDREFINSNFRISLLWCERKISSARLKTFSERFGWISLPLSVTVIKDTHQRIKEKYFQELERAEEKISPRRNWAFPRKIFQRSRYGRNCSKSL